MIFSSLRNVTNMFALVLYFTRRIVLPKAFCLDYWNIEFYLMHRVSLKKVYQKAGRSLRLQKYRCVSINQVVTQSRCICLHCGFTKCISSRVHRFVIFFRSFVLHLLCVPGHEFYLRQPILNLWQIIANWRKITKCEFFVSQQLAV